MAILGNAAGTAARAYGHFFPEAQVDGVEIDPALEEVGNRYFDMGSNENLTVHNEDARPWLRRSDGDYDVIIVDAYRQPYIPFYLATRGVLRACPRPARAGRARRGQRRPRAGATTTSRGCSAGRWRPRSRRCCATRSRDSNTLLVASEAPTRRITCCSRIRRAPAGPAGRSRDRRRAPIGPRLPGGDVYTDDRAPVEWLIDRSILGYASDE